MKNKALLVFFALVSSLLVLGMSVLAVRLFVSGNRAEAAVVVIGFLALIAIFFVVLKRFSEANKLGLPIQDERSQRIKMYAAGYAYFVSLYVWLALFLFQKHLDSDDVILTGMLGMVISFGISWFVLSRKKDFV